METYAQEYMIAFEESIDLYYGEETRSVNLVIPEKPKEIGAYLNLHTPDGEAIAYPGTGEAVLTKKNPASAWEMKSPYAMRMEIA